jgi:replicative DNA helicase
MEDNVDVPFDYQVLASCFRVPGAIVKFVEELDPKDVGDVHGFTGIYEFYKNILAFYTITDIDPIDPVAFRSWLQTESDIYDALGGSAGVDLFMATLFDIELSDIDTIIKLVQFRARQRRQLNNLQELKNLIANKGQLDNKAIDKIKNLTDQINELEDDLEYNPLASVRTAHDIRDSIDELWSIPPFLTTQFVELNKALGYTDEGGFFRGGVHSVVALSGFGKSTFVKCLCNHWLDSGYTVLFINFEEAQSHWERILMTQIIKKNVYAEAGSMTSVELSKNTEIFKSKLEEWGDRLMVRHDPDTLFFEDLEKWLRDILGDGARKPDVVVIDTIQSMFIKSGGKARWGEFEQIMVRLEKLAKDMDAVFVITAQQNINSTKEKREVVNQSDMGGSITITQKSTVAMFLTPLKTAENDESITENLMQVQIPKNRVTGTAFASDPPVIVYDDSIKSYVPFVKLEDERYNTSYIEDRFDDGGPTY